MSLATKLKELRRKTGESLQQVADEVKVSKAHIWELERGSTSNPSMEILKNLANHFKVTVAYLTDDEAAPDDASAIQFFRDFDGELSPRDWETLRGLAKDLKDRNK